jgi:hypothetical protein
MKRARVICSDTTEQTLVMWAHSKDPGGPKPSLDAAATLALDEFARVQRDLVERLADAAQIADKRKGRFPR